MTSSSQEIKIAGHYFKLTFILICFRSALEKNFILSIKLPILLCRHSRQKNYIISDEINNARTLKTTPSSIFSGHKPIL